MYNHYDSQAEVLQVFYALDLAILADIPRHTMSKYSHRIEESTLLIARSCYLWSACHDRNGSTWYSSSANDRNTSVHLRQGEDYLPFACRQQTSQIVRRR